MTRTWYPVIDYTLCTECGSCISKCPHFVYDSSKAPTPVVNAPDSCVDHCHGCGNRCPVGAITYVGEDTGWTPPNGTIGEERPEESCCQTSDLSKSKPCSSSEDRVAGFSKSAVVEYLCLDLSTCDRCIGTDRVLDEVMMSLSPALSMAGFQVDYKKIVISTEKEARKYRFVSSPTIRVNGRDVFSSVEENPCACCGELSGTDVNCRVYEYNGQVYEVPTEEMLAESILLAIFSGQDTACASEDYELPQNLKDFFEGKKNKSACSCGDTCC